MRFSERIVLVTIFSAFFMLAVAVTAFFVKEIGMLFLLGALIIAAHIIVYFTLSGALIGPITSLVKTSKSIASGNFSIRSTIVSADEFGEFAKTINVLAQQLQQSQEKINQLGITTQTVNPNRMLQIQQQNEELEKTKTAMLNLLEDARELEKNLNQEQANVEKKVQDRTKELSEEQARLNASINSLTKGLIMTDAHNKILNINKAARNILGLKLTEITIEEVSKRLQGKVDLPDAMRKCLTTHTPYEFKEILLGSQYLQIFISPIISDTNEAIGTVLFIDDITEIKAIARSKDEFFSIASHELRTPLTAIRGNTSLIQQYFMETIQNTELKEMIEDIHKSAIRLIAIVNDFLDTSRLEMGKMTFKKESFDIVKVTDDTSKEYMTSGSMKRLDIHIDLPKTPLPQVVADVNKFKQVIINLIGNAIKFTEAGTVSIHFELQGNNVCVFVGDTGMGIAPENQAYLFRKFQQAGSSIFTRDTTRGTGLGLYISKMMMEGMNGKIWLVSSEVGKGTTFGVSLPSAG